MCDKIFSGGYNGQGGKWSTDYLAWGFGTAIPPTKFIKLATIIMLILAIFAFSIGWAYSCTVMNTIPSAHVLGGFAITIGLVAFIYAIMSLSYFNVKREHHTDLFVMAIASVFICVYASLATLAGSSINLTGTPLLIMGSLLGSYTIYRFAKGLQWIDKQGDEPASKTK